MASYEQQVKVRVARKLRSERQALQDEYETKNGELEIFKNDLEGREAAVDALRNDLEEAKAEDIERRTILKADEAE